MTSQVNKKGFIQVHEAMMDDLITMLSKADDPFYKEQARAWRRHARKFNPEYAARKDQEDTTAADKRQAKYSSMVAFLNANREVDLKYPGFGYCILPPDANPEEKLAALETIRVHSVDKETLQYVYVSQTKDKEQRWPGFADVRFLIKHNPTIDFGELEVAADE